MTSANHATNDNRIELLAPAKNADFGIESIIHGADAVYIGGPAFGARANAGNSLDDIKRLCDFAHGYGAQVFVALNTILTDKQLAQAETLVNGIYQAGADALIVQDMGLLQLNLPPIALHASTQMDNRTVEKVKFLEQVGFSQVVLARELALPQIATIAAQTQTRLEFFIHGALCVSYSGQCYISHAMTGRSANRGECAQICRLPCNLKHRDGQLIAENQHLLSLKDNNQTSNLEALAAAGVRSFKIEGRLKDLNYVKNITAHYRQQLDKILDKNPHYQAGAHGRCQFNFIPNPDKSFNRGKTDYFVNQRQHELANFDTPKYLGQQIGKVTAMGHNWFELQLTQGRVEPLNNGDGLSYFSSHYQKQQQSDAKIAGLRINRVDGCRIYLADKTPKDLAVGTVIYRNHDHIFDALLSKESAKREIAVDFILTDTNDGIELTVTDDYGHQCSVTLNCEKQAARDHERTKEQLSKGLAKLGNTPFVARNVNIKTEQVWFLPVSQVNQLRRDAITQLIQQRLTQYQRPLAWARDNTATFPLSNLSYLGNVANQQAKAFYQQHGVINIEPAYEHNQVSVDAPLMITKHCLRYSFNQCPKEGQVDKAEPMLLEIGNEMLKLVFDCQKCEMLVVGRNSNANTA